VCRRLSDFPNPSRNAQVFALASIIQDELQMKWSLAQIGSIFDIHKGTVHRIRSQGTKDYEASIGHPTLLSSNEEVQVIQQVRTSFASGCPLSPKQLREYVRESFAKHASRGWVWHFVRRHSGELDHAKAYPQEDARMNITKETARIHIANLINYVKDVPTELVFNIDEVGSQEWADRKPRSVIIPHQERPRKIHYSVRRSQKRISCIAAISMAGDTLMPLLIIHRKTVDQAVWEEGWRNGQDFLLRCNDTSYVTRDIFKDYLTEVFLKYVGTVRASMNLGDSPAVLLCDNCTAHIDEEIKILLTQNNIRLLTFPPHTSHLFQPLDLVTFSVFKREHNDLRVKLPKGSQVWRITKLMKALERATDSSTNRAAFKRAGLVINPAVFPPVAMVKREELLALVAESQLADTPPSTGADGNPEIDSDDGQGPIFGFLNRELFDNL
jgi:hypothetical protein